MTSQRVAFPTVGGIRSRDRTNHPTTQAGVQYSKCPLTSSIAGRLKVNNKTALKGPHVQVRSQDLIRENQMDGILIDVEVNTVWSPKD